MAGNKFSNADFGSLPPLQQDGGLEEQLLKQLLGAALQKSDVQAAQTPLAGPQGEVEALFLAGGGGTDRGKTRGSTFGDLNRTLEKGGGAGTGSRGQQQQGEILLQNMRKGGADDAAIRARLKQKNLLTPAIEQQLEPEDAGGNFFTNLLQSIFG